MRGKEIKNTVRKLIRRITPACAGKRIPFGYRTEDKRDHPRVCGEKLVFFVVYAGF